MTPGELPVISTEPRTVAEVLMACEACGTPVPVSIDAWVGTDDDGDEVLYTAGSTLDLEAHLISHGPITMGAPPLPLICVECGNDDVCEGYDMCSECLETFGT